MFVSVKHWFGIFVIVALGGPVTVPDFSANGPSTPANGAWEGLDLGRGQYGGDLRLLRSFCTLPRDGESNFFLDLWEPGNLASFARLQGLTNNHALMIDSHSTEHLSWKGRQFVFRPGTAAMTAGAPASLYSIRDVARILGPSATEIHNIVIAGCNEAGVLDPAVFRRYFVNATNVTYMAAGQRSYKPQFYQMLTQHSEDQEQLYERVISREGQRVCSEICRSPVEGSRPLGWYVADLFRPGEVKPFQRQRAGRELLDPETPRDALTKRWGTDAAGLRLRLQQERPEATIRSD
jgi:hypothetical protein